MLRLTGIVKEYTAGDTVVPALRGINLEFRKSEFVSILGPSGCGKTTLLNIIGGLDRYTAGEMTVGGTPTKEFTASDWDSYRNHSIGFVFQTYNLISHQTVIANVELALTLSGVSKAERRRRAEEVLQKVGLGDQMRKKPNQLSGGQMQRVAIARALVNDPEILLADEPTGALDSETSVQIMELLKEIARDRLVVMVTHNPELASKYSTRIVRLLDGRVIDDTNPYVSGAVPVKTEKKRRRRVTPKTSMSFLTALSLSLNNLLTKKTRTLLTAFAGSIGIIGIALIISLSSGVQNYITRMEEDTLSTYPITIDEESYDYTSLLTMMTGHSDVDRTGREANAIYSNNQMGDMLELLSSEKNTNDLTAFKSYLTEHGDEILPLVTSITYSYDVGLNVYASDTAGGIVQVNPSTLSGSLGMNPMAASYQNYDVFQEMIDNQDFLNQQYDVIAGRWPTAYNELVLIVDENNEISDLALYTLGLKDQEELLDAMASIGEGGEADLDTSVTEYSYDELMGLTFKLIPDTAYFEKQDGEWIDVSADEDAMEAIVGAGAELRIVGILRPSEDAVATSMTGAIGYTAALTDYLIDTVNNSEVVLEQLADPDTDVFTGQPFYEGGTSVENFDWSTLTAEQQAALAALSEEDRAKYIEQLLGQQNTYEGNLDTLGVVDQEKPSSILIYPAGFEEKEAVEDFIDDYNGMVTDEGREDQAISYTDFIGMFMSSVNTFIDVVSYILIAFVAISLVVSSIMIGIITYISVLERTKEIGILRSVGASKRDISRVFNAETLIVGFIAGAMGIGITLLLLIPGNAIIYRFTDVSSLATLPVLGGAALVLISMFLTLVAGIIPSRLAAKKDPVTALRTE